MQQVLQSPISEIFPAAIKVDSKFDPVIKGMTLDSRKVKSEFLFVAKPGEKFDGRKFIDEAIANGASVVLSEDGSAKSLSVHASGCPIYSYSNLDSVLGAMAARFYRTAEGELKVIGITGTNGKTSVSHFVAQALGILGFKVAVMGTVGNGFPGQLEKSALTTLDVLSVHENLNRFSEAGAEFVCMEVSSHSLDQGRVSGVRFNCAVFTNLSRDHLDYHQDMEDYLKAKEKLFQSSGLQKAVINKDKAGKKLLDTLSGEIEVLTMAKEGSADLQITSMLDSFSGLEIEFEFRGQALKIANQDVIGRINAENLLLSFLVLMQAGIESGDACKALAKVQAVKGRLQKIRAEEDSDIRVFVDYAHTPDGLKKVLKSLAGFVEGEREEGSDDRKLIVVFGCGGDRDRKKRKQMAKVAEKYADFVYVTSDNPRTEAQAQITEDILSGFSDKFMETVFIEEDRELAIENAILSAGPGDTVVIAGKGHEQVQIFSDHEIEFSDELVALNVLNEKRSQEVSQ